ncbi:MAG: rhomboid family intramembrane serine protease [Candidatus Aenigmatarchaeota archaeon]
MRPFLKTLGISLSIALPCCGVFFLIADSLGLLAFSGQAFFSGELWRLLTFPLAHVNLSHLIENMAALAITTLLVLEFELNNRLYLESFFLSGILIALGFGLAVPILPIAGASLGIYSVLGSLSIGGSNFIPRYILIPLLGLSIFAMQGLGLATQQGISTQGINSSLFHLAGFIMGIGLFYLLPRLRPKKAVLKRL